MDYDTDLVRTYRKVFEEVYTIHSPSLENGWLYVITCEPPPGFPRPVKLGYSDDVERRLKDLTTGFPWRLYIYGAFKGLGSMEAMLHRRLRPLRSSYYRGEWYETELLEAVMSLPQYIKKHFVKGEVPRDLSRGVPTELNEKLWNTIKLMIALGDDRTRARYQEDLHRIVPPSRIEEALQKMLELGYLRASGRGLGRKFRLTKLAKDLLQTQETYEP